MSGCITVSDEHVNEIVHFSHVQSPGGFRAECKRCNTFCAGSELSVANWAETHTYEHLESDRENEEYKQIYSEMDEKYPEIPENTKDSDDPNPTQAELNAKDAQDLFRIIDWLRINRPDTRLAGENPTDWIIRVLDMSPRLITTVEQLDALPLPNPDHLAGVLIKCTALVDPNNGKYGLGDVYERNTDGTWCMLQDPSGADWGERRVASKDIPLPAVVLWIPTL